MRRRVLAITLVLGAAASVLALAGCPSTITPPLEPADPVSVFLIDYGRHASLALPAADAERPLTEYSYGDWRWYALDESAWYDTFSTVLWPTQGALGRRPLPVEPTAQSVHAYVGGETVLEIAVERAAAHELLAGLDRQFEEHRETAHYQPRYDLTFAHHDEAFHTFHNCNHVVAEWLRACGCELRGPTLLANFRLSARAERSQAGLARAGEAARRAPRNHRPRLARRVLVEAQFASEDWEGPFVAGAGSGGAGALGWNSRDERAEVSAVTWDLESPEP